jgi:hypothetical protein
MKPACFCRKVILTLKLLFQQFSAAASDRTLFDVTTMMDVLSALHDPIDGATVSKHPSFVRLCRNLKKIQVCSRFEESFFLN